MDGARKMPIGFAHRGARVLVRENTLEAFSRALELGAAGIESDAWLTSDGVVVLDHDGVTGAPWRRRRIADQERRSLPSHIPALEDLYRELGADFELSLDVKDPAALGPVLQAAAAADAIGRLWLCDDSAGRAMSSVLVARPARVVLSARRVNQLEGGVGPVARRLAEAGVSALNLHGSEWHIDEVAEVHGSGLLAFAWDAQSERDIRRLVDLGVDGIYSDHVDRLVAGLAAALPGRGSTARPGATGATP